MDPTVEKWLHELGEHAFDLGMCASDYIHSQQLTLNAAARYAVHAGWQYARDVASGLVVN